MTLPQWSPVDFGRKSLRTLKLESVSSRSVGGQCYATNTRETPTVKPTLHCCPYQAARVIADECVVASLEYDINVETTFNMSWEGDNASTSQVARVNLEGGESSVPWDQVLRAGEDS